MAVCTGNLSTATFATSGLALNLKQIGGVEMTVEAIDDSHLGTTNFRTFCPSDLADPGEFEVEFEFDPDLADDLLTAIQLGASETVTITYPSTKANGSTLVGSCFMTAFRTADLNNDGQMLGSMTWKFDGKTEPAFTDATT